MIQLMTIWVVFAVVAYTYFKNLFAELGFEWTDGNRAGVLALCVAGPAALVMAIVVDGTRPLQVLSNQIA